MNPKKAIKELEKQLRKDPDNLVLRLRLAANYREVGRTQEAVALYRSVAVAYHAQGRLAQAIAVCRSVLEIEPSQPETQRLLAELDQMRQYSAAQEVAEHVAASGQDIPSLAQAPKARTPGPRRSSASIPVARPPSEPPTDAPMSFEPLPPLPPLPPPRPLPAEPGPPPFPGRPPSPGEFGPGSGLTPRSDLPEDIAPVEALPVQMARLRDKARAKTPAPRTTERMSQPPRRVSGPLLTPTPLPEPLALHDTGDSQPSIDPLRSLPARATLRGHSARPQTPAPLPPPEETGRVRRPTADDVDDDAMTRIADDGFEELLGAEVIEDIDADFDGLTAPLPPRQTDDEAKTTIAPDLPLASPDVDDDAMTRIADESGLLPLQTTPERRPPSLPQPAVFTRATRRIEDALKPRDFDDLPTGADDEGPTRFEEPPQAAVTVPIVEPGVASAPAVSELDRFRTDIGMDEDEETDHGPTEDEPTNPGGGEGAQTRVKSVPSKGVHDSMRLDRAFKGSFSETLDRLAPDGAVIDVPLEIFRELPEQALAEMARRMSLRHFEPGDVIVREGEPGNACFVIAHGGVRILKRDPLSPGAQIEVGRLGSGALFGEFALLADRRRHATVEATEPSEIYEIPRRLLRELAANYVEVGPALESFFRERLLANVMWTAPFFKPLAEDRRSQLLARFKPLRADSGARIVREGEPAGGLYLIVLGSVEITKRVGERRSVLLATLGEGAYFGEMSLLRGGVANASVTAVGPTELAVMSPKDFYEVVSENPLLWDEVRREANRRQLENNQIVTGETNVV